MNLHAPGKANLIGLSAILMWATLPLLIVTTKTLPPFQVITVAFTIAFGVTLLKWRMVDKASIAERMRLPTRVWLLGIWGIFGFHFAYFMAMRLAPPVEALLIDNLWPLLIVLFSLLVEREALRWWHIAGCIAGFLGVLVMTGKGHAFSFETAYLPGYFAAFCCAFIWSSYSILSRYWSAMIPKEAVGAYCGAAALLSLICHLLLEETQPISSPQALVILLMGLGPMGLSFFAWDYGVRRGDIRTLGALSYMNALVGALLLVLFGYAQFTVELAMATVLILGGAALGSLGMLKQE